MSSLAKQVAVVTGASSGIGKAIAVALAASGASVCLVGRQLASLQSVAESITGVQTHFCYSTDLASDSDIHKLISAISRDMGGVDILIHGAGVISLGGIEKASIEQFDRQYATNVRAPYLLTQGLLPLLKHRRGQIVFLNSSAGLSARADTAQYAASKHALRALADSVRAEVNPDGVRVLSLFLGRTATPMQAAIFASEGKSYRPELLIQPEDVACVALCALTVPRTVEITDISLRPLVKSY